MTKTIADEATCGAEDATARHVQRTDPSWRENEIVDSILKLRIKNLPTRHIVLLIHFKRYYQVSFGMCFIFLLSLALKVIHIYYD